MSISSTPEVWGRVLSTHSPPLGNESLKNPSMASHVLPSPPQTRHLSSLASDPKILSQPTCWKQRRIFSVPKAGTPGPLVKRAQPTHPLAFPAKGIQTRSVSRLCLHSQVILASISQHVIWKKNIWIPQECIPTFPD